MVDLVTGVRVEVTVPVGVSRDRLWELVTDVPRYGDWSPECTGTEWLDAAGPTVGARFTGHNTFPNGFESTTVCVVTEAHRPDVFGWVVLDDAEDVDRPGSIWRYELLPDTGGRTLLRHTFEHGPGDSGVRARAARQGPAAVADRLDTICRNMTTSITRMTAEDK